MNLWDEPDGLLLVRIEHITKKTFRNGRKNTKKKEGGKRREIHVQGSNAEAAVVRGQRRVVHGYERVIADHWASGTRDPHRWQRQFWFQECLNSMINAYISIRLTALF
jgi:hypothetical protein